MQMEAVRAEREAARLLPEVLAELFDEDQIRVQPTALEGPDLAARGWNRDWVFEVKASSSPGFVATAAERLRAAAPPGALAVLVVPFMTDAGRRTATELGLNWIDLAGNAEIRDEDLYIHVLGRPNRFSSAGRPSSPFAPKSARATRVMLLDPDRWWRQKELAEATGLSDGQVSRVVGRLAEQALLEREGALFRPLKASRLLDAWSDEYRFERHEVLYGHASGSGIELARDLHRRLGAGAVEYAFTGLPAAWALRSYSRFRLNSVYVEGDPHAVAERLDLRIDDRGANVQLICPDDNGVFAGRREVDSLPCVSAVQVYLDLLHLPERASEAAEDLREWVLWN